MRIKLLPLFCFLLCTWLSVPGCSEDGPFEKMTFRSSEYTNDVASRLENRGVRFRRLDETTIVFSVKDSSEVLAAVAELDAELPLVYRIYGLERKDFFAKSLKNAEIPFKSYENDNGGYSFFIERKYQDTAQEIFELITK